MCVCACVLASMYLSILLKSCAILSEIFCLLQHLLSSQHEHNCRKIALVGMAWWMKFLVFLISSLLHMLLPLIETILLLRKTCFYGGLTVYLILSSSTDRIWSSGRFVLAKYEVNGHPSMFPPFLLHFSNFCYFLFISLKDKPSKMGSTLKRKNLLLKEQILSFES